MNAAMATRNSTQGETVFPKECTKVTAHKSQLSIFDGIQDQVFDFTEYRLKRMISDESTQPKKRAMLTTLMLHYIKGDVRIGWRRGQPVHVPLTKEG